MVPSDVSPVSVVWQGAPVITNVVPSFGVSFGAADFGSGSLLAIQQISLVSIPASPVVASLSQADALASKVIDSVSSGVSICSTSPLCREKEDSFPVVMDPILSPASVDAHAKTVRNPSLALGLIRWNFFGPRVVSPPRAVVEEASLSIQGCKDSNPALVKADENPAPIYSFVSKSQLGYSRRVKEKVAKQLHKNKELLAEIVVETPVEGVEGYSKGVLDAMNLGPVVGLSWGAEDKFFGPFFVIDKREPIIGVSAPKVKGIRELKNLDCSISPVKC